MKSIKFLIALCLLGCNADHTDSSKLSTTDYDLLETDDFSSPEIRTRLLKDYAVCSCIQTGYNNNKIFKCDNSISVLVDIANFSPEVYVRIDFVCKRLYSKNAKKSNW